jgi:GrpB-like predicted nucleotidyltransferase (UPF0157 family)
MNGRLRFRHHPGAGRVWRMPPPALMPPCPPGRPLGSSWPGHVMLGSAGWDSGVLCPSRAGEPRWAPVCAQRREGGKQVAKGPSTDDEITAARVSGTVTPHNAAIMLAQHDPEWSMQYAGEERKIRVALGSAAVVVEHVGSTAIPGIPAKPTIDILLAVWNSTDELAYVPALEAQGYRLHIREPGWHQHRLLKGDRPPVNLHVFTVGSSEIVRMIAFRDRCRLHPQERALYKRTKLELASRVWRHVQHYANAKGEVIEEIIARALADRD